MCKTKRVMVMRSSPFDGALSVEFRSYSMCSRFNHSRISQPHHVRLMILFMSLHDVFPLICLDIVLSGCRIVFLPLLLGVFSNSNKNIYLQISHVRISA
jgi:hypothetical protein